MGRLIDAEELKKQQTHLWDEVMGHIPCVLLYDIDIAPTIDAVPVVRCKDCKYCGQFPYATTTDMRCQCRDMYWYPTNPDDFCSYGERKSDD